MQVLHHDRERPACSLRGMPLHSGAHRRPTWRSPGQPAGHR